MSKESVDIFAWAVNTDGIKQDLFVEFFLFSKNYVPYSTRTHSNMEAMIKPLFLYDIVNFVQLGAGTGLSVRPIETGETQNVLKTTPLTNVGRAETLIHIIENERDGIVEFSEPEHEFSRIKGIVAKFSLPDDPSKVFYVVKQIKNTLVGRTSLAFNDGQFETMQQEAVLKFPSDNQVLIIDGDIFIFNESKFVALFNYNAHERAEIERVGAEIDKAYRLSMPTIGQGIAFMTKEKPMLAKKLLAIKRVGEVTQEKAIEICDDMQLELMTDDSGKIILMDGTDVATFLDVIGDNLYKSDATGHAYVAKSKTEISPEEE